MQPLYNPFSRKISNGISLVCAVKNRTWTLLNSLQSWLEYDEIDEIIIVDWSSEESVINALDSMHEKITVIQIDNEKRWHLTAAYNLGFSFCSKDIILKFDTDIVIRRNLFHLLPENGKSFLAGNWLEAEDETQVHLNGTFLVARNDLLKVNGFNEKINTYGWDDDDLYLRLIGSGLVRKCIAMRSLYHLPHPDSLRTAYQPEIISVKDSIEENRVRFTEQSAILSQHPVKNTPMMQFTIVKIDNTKKHVLVKRI